MNKQHKVVYNGDSNERVDAFLAKSGLVHSRSLVEKLVEQGLVKVGGKVVRKSAKLKSGDIIEFEIPPPEPIEPEPENIPLSIIYQDSKIAVIDKPAGLLTHPSRGFNSGTLVNALLYHIKDLSGIRGSLRPGIVHRLDKDTSGLLVVAKSDEAHSGLHEQFKDRSVEKTYLAVAYGVFERKNGKLDSKIARHPTDRKKMAPSALNGKDALTIYKVLSSNNGFSLVELEIKTGRTHQIRVHLSEIGHPIVGDKKYGGGPNRANNITNQNARQAAVSMKRQALHARTLCFDHPISGKRLEFSSRPPKDFIDLAESLGFAVPE